MTKFVLNPFIQERQANSRKSPGSYMLVFTVYRFVMTKFPDWVLHLDRSPFDFKFFNYSEHQETLFRLV